MKIKLGKLARVLAAIVVNAPLVIAAAKPVIDAARRPGKPEVPANLADQQVTERG